MPHSKTALALDVMFLLHILVSKHMSILKLVAFAFLQSNLACTC